jgi:hypothetical protein
MLDSSSADDELREIIDDVQVEVWLFLQPPRPPNPHVRNLDVPA